MQVSHRHSGSIRQLITDDKGSSLLVFLMSPCNCVLSGGSRNVTYLFACVVLLFAV